MFATWMGSEFLAVPEPAPARSGLMVPSYGRALTSDAQDIAKHLERRFSGNVLRHSSCGRSEDGNIRCSQDLATPASSAQPRRLAPRSIQAMPNRR